MNQTMNDTDTHKPLWVCLEVRDSEGSILQEKEVDFHSRVGRTNIAKTAWWAMHSGFTLLTWPREESK